MPIKTKRRFNQQDYRGAIELLQEPFQLSRSNDEFPWIGSSIKRYQTCLRIEGHIFDLPKGHSKRHMERRTASLNLLNEIQYFLNVSTKTITLMGIHGGRRPVQDVRPIGEQLTWRISGFVRSELKPNRSLRRFLLKNCLSVIKHSVLEMDELFDLFDMHPIQNPTTKKENHHDQIH